MTYILVHSQLAPLPSKLKDGNDEGDEHAADEDHEHTTEVGQSKLGAATASLSLQGESCQFILVVDTPSNTPYKNHLPSLSPTI